MRVIADPDDILRECALGNVVNPENVCPACARPKRAEGDLCVSCENASRDELMAAFTMRGSTK